MQHLWSAVKQSTVKWGMLVTQLHIKTKYIILVKEIQHNPEANNVMFKM